MFSLLLAWLLLIGNLNFRIEASVVTALIASFAGFELDGSVFFLALLVEELPGLLRITVDS